MPHKDYEMRSLFINFFSLAPQNSGFSFSLLFLDLGPQAPKTKYETHNSKGTVQATAIHQRFSVFFPHLTESI